MKRIWLSLLALSASLWFCCSVQATNTVEMTITSPIIHRDICQKIGDVNFAFDAGSDLMAGDWWYMDLPYFLTICEPIDYLIVGNTGAGTNTVDITSGPTSSVFSPGTSIQTMPPGATSGPLSVNSLDAGASQALVSGGDVAIRVTAQQGSNRLYLTVYGSTATASITVGIDTNFSIHILDGALHTGNILLDSDSNGIYGDSGAADLLSGPIPDANNYLSGIVGETDAINIFVSFKSLNDKFTYTGQALIAQLANYALTLDKAGTGNGTVTSNPSGIDCGGACTASFGENTEVSLSADSAADSAFDGWSDVDCPGNGDCSVTMDQVRTITATFNIDWDGDGISDNLEDAGPNGGDGNNDGSSDSIQTNVATFRDIDGNWISLVAEVGTVLSQVTFTPTPGSAGRPLRNSYPFGAIGFTATGFPGTMADIAITFESLPARPVIYKVSNDVWKQIYPKNETTGIINVALNGNMLSYTIEDGSDCDADGLVNGIIEDPVVVGSSPPGDSGGCFINTVAKDLLELLK